MSETMEISEKTPNTTAPMEEVHRGVRGPTMEEALVKTHTRHLSGDTLIEGSFDIQKPKLKEVTEDTKVPQPAIDLEAQTVVGEQKRFSSLRFAFFTVYRRLFTIVALVNIATFIYVMVSDQKLLALVNATAANLLACGLARQPLVVNTIFFVVCSIPRSAPFWLRRYCSQAYHYGGVHSGCGIASLLWYLGFVGLLSHQYWNPGPVTATTVTFTAAPVVLTYIVLVLLLVIIAVAHPKFRMKRHDYFELTHRFTGWAVVAMFVALLLLPAFWFLVVTVIAIIHPWILLRKVPVKAEHLSSHAVRLHFDHAQTAFGKGIQLAKHPLRDWHGFATFKDQGPEGPRGHQTRRGHRRGPSFSCLVSKAGDWTGDSIKQPPSHFWKRGVLIFGFAYAMRVYKRLIVVTTGSGIGPCLSFIGDEKRPDLRVMWQTRSPLTTYGQEVIDLTKIMDPEPLILDTNLTGRIDMVPMIQREFKQFNAEAVCVVSNPKLTQRIVFELESRGIPAFGPIFDS
ncbi:hypothetical protein N7468_001545 [Penicillium chermesinum]|uniref:Integral membrane protein TmpA n=1 Tax=Penicillium chermesinum TaxID=63820 RepID=A0A9W9TX71_9EURO|nr:uncharacterized protein N7468_001545 [Penicillium chermesinum]KAJ5246562.1 hypothetical protein N7468_001545 [Penicillium chermesinum]